MNIICERCFEDSVKANLIKIKEGEVFLFNMDGKKCFICEEVKDKVLETRQVLSNGKF